VRVSSEKQTLILAGESIPPRADAGSQLKRVTMLLVQGEYAPAQRTVTVESIPASAPAGAGAQSALLAPAAAIDDTAGEEMSISLPAAPADYRGLSAGAAEYARTQSLSGGRARRQIIDTYA
jgi:hypothetical protein